MAVTKQFECENCEAVGKIVLRGNDLEKDDIVFCPCCGHDIYEDDDDIDEE